MNLEESKLETQKHILRVQELLQKAIRNLGIRSQFHDQSKLEEPEASVFAKYTPLLRNSTYGSDEYKQFLVEMKPAIDHHYANNSHHPEYYANGISGMSLLDLLEMLADWKAAGERHADGDMMRSLTVNKERFGIDEQLWGILVNTARELNYV